MLALENDEVGGETVFMLVQSIPHRLAYFDSDSGLPMATGFDVKVKAK